jgi:hypothetical protein
MKLRRQGHAYHRQCCRFVNSEEQPESIKFPSSYLSKFDIQHLCGYFAFSNAKFTGAKQMEDRRKRLLKGFHFVETFALSSREQLYIVYRALPTQGYIPVPELSNTT